MAGSALAWLVAAAPAVAQDEIVIRTVGFRDNSFLEQCMVEFDVRVKGLDDVTRVLIDHRLELAGAGEPAEVACTAWQAREGMAGTETICPHQVSFTCNDVERAVVDDVLCEPGAGMAWNCGLVARVLPPRDAMARRLHVALPDYDALLDRCTGDDGIAAADRAAACQGVILAAADPGILAELHYRRGSALESLGRTEEALDALNQALLYDPTLGLALQLRVQLLMQRGQYEQAIADVEAAAAEPALAGALWRMIGEALADTGQFDRALEIIHRAVAAMPEDAEAYDLLGQVLEFSGDADRAIDAYRQALSLDPQRWHINARLGDLLSEAGDDEDAIGAYSAALDGYRASGADAEVIGVALVSRGRAYEALGETAAARADFDAALDLPLPDDHAYVAHFYRGRAAFSDGDDEAALADFTWTVETEPTDWSAWYYRGRINDALGDHETAVADLSVAIDLNDQFAWTYYYRAFALSLADQDERALGDYDQAIALGMDSAYAFTGRAFSLARLGRNEDALADYDAALTLDPDLAFAYSERGDLHLTLGAVDLALADLRRALELSPSQQAGNHLAWELYLLGRYDEALQVVEEALALEEPDQPEAVDTHAHVLAALGHAEAAMAAYERAMRLGGEDWVTLYQETLRDRGYGDIEPTGELDPPTRAALRRCVVEACPLMEDVPPPPPDE
ncbi:MAG: tetratricopeptide repeat protein [Rhodospirillaceae bacterium]|nr:tetratricopeptide repeat protein [Rhodospirillaceae bacterium]